MLNAFIVFPDRRGLIIYARKLAVRNGKELFEMVADGKIETFDIFNIKGIGGLFIKDIRLYGGNSILFDCIPVDKNKLDYEYEEEDDIWRMV